jgi:hypothetical protein
MNKGQIIIGSITTLGFIILSGFFFFGSSEISKDLREPLLLVTGCWITNFTTLINWLFGSSKGSADKTKLMAGTGKG